MMKMKSRKGFAVQITIYSMLVAFGVMLLANVAFSFFHSKNESIIVVEDKFEDDDGAKQSILFTNINTRERDIVEIAKDAVYINANHGDIYEAIQPGEVYRVEIDDAHESFLFSQWTRAIVKLERLDFVIVDDDDIEDTESEKGVMAE